MTNLTDTDVVAFLTANPNSTLADLATQFNSTKPEVTKLVNKLVLANKVFRTGSKAGAGRGRPSTTFGTDSSKAVVLAPLPSSVAPSATVSAAVTSQTTPTVTEADLAPTV
jgi:hypothetical protein